MLKINSLEDKLISILLYYLKENQQLKTTSLIEHIEFNMFMLPLCYY